MLVTTSHPQTRWLRLPATALTATVWLSSGLFALFILAFYLGALAGDDLTSWNAFLPGLHADDGRPAATAGIGVHFALGAVILLLGPVQLLPAVRSRWPRFHRVTGRIYIAAAILTGLGGLLFIALRGTVGGPMMSASFALYGTLMVLAAGQTLRHAMARRLELHRAWAIRLFALAIGSWLYRMDYGFWFAIMGQAGHTDAFDGWFDRVMNLWFFLPNLAVAEAFIRARQAPLGPTVRIAAGTAMVIGTLFLLLATWFFLTRAWWPAIVWGPGLER